VIRLAITRIQCFELAQAIQMADAHRVRGEYSPCGVSVIVWEHPVSLAHCRRLLRAVASPPAKISKEHVPRQLVLSACVQKDVTGRKCLVRD